jgi:hypothetical protein
MTNTDAALRPVERRMRKLEADGVDSTEIAARFKRSPEHVERILELARLAGRQRVVAIAPDQRLRPIERRLLHGQAEGASLDALARQFRRSPAHIARVLALAEYKRSARRPNR